MYSHNFVEVTPDFLLWLNPHRDNVVKNAFEIFEEYRNEFNKNLDSGKYDSIIKDMFNPKSIEIF